MKSFEHDYYVDTPVSHSFVMAMRAMGEFRGRQELFAEQSPELLETLRRVAMVQSSESSNRIEGITVAAERIEELILKKVRPKDRSEQEVAGYRDVLALIHSRHSSLVMSCDLIRHWHRDMYRFTEERGGEWKPRDNAIWEIRPDGRRVVRFQPASAIVTPKHMDRLVSMFHRALDERKVDPILLIASFILDFECIHPFMDGNGRVGRLLTLLLLYQAGYEVGRYISLERIVEESKETYYEALLESSKGWHEGRHDLRPWWNYFLGMLTAASKEFESRAGNMASARGAKRQMVQDAVRRLPDRFKFEDVRRACPGVSYPTLKRALEDMKRQKRIRCLGKGRDAQWMRIAP